MTARRNCMCLSLILLVRVSWATTCRSSASWVFVMSRPRMPGSGMGHQLHQVLYRDYLLRQFGHIVGKTVRIGAVRSSARGIWCGTLTQPGTEKYLGFYDGSRDREDGAGMEPTITLILTALAARGECWRHR